MVATPAGLTPIPHHSMVAAYRWAEGVLTHEPVVGATSAADVAAAFAHRVGERVVAVFHPMDRRNRGCCVVAVQGKGGVLWVYCTLVCSVPTIECVATPMV